MCVKRLLLSLTPFLRYDTHTHTHTLSLSLSLTHTHTHWAHSLNFDPFDKVIQYWPNDHVNKQMLLHSFHVNRNVACLELQFFTPISAIRHQCLVICSIIPQRKESYFDADHIITLLEASFAEAISALSTWHLHGGANSQLGRQSSGTEIPEEAGEEMKHSHENSAGEST